MNPDRIYQQYRDDALALQITAKVYSTFVAMPFEERFSYPSREIFNKVICGAAKEANCLIRNGRKFAEPMRADDEPGTAGVITEEIVTRILESHVFLADLTFQNPGVLLEAGIALGLKPNKQIILITQDPLNNLHFDIRNNRVLRYTQPGGIDRIAGALKAGVMAFETDREKYIDLIVKTLSSDAIRCLHFYGELCHKKPDKKPSLHYGVVNESLKFSRGDFIMAVRELLERRLIWSDFKANTGRYGMHATALGWAVIEDRWPNLCRKIK